MAAAALAATALIVIANGGSTQSSRGPLNLSVTQYVGGQWQVAGPEPVTTASYGRVLTRHGLTLSAVVSSGVDGAGDIYLVVTGSPNPSRSSINQQFVAKYSPAGRLESLARLPSSLDCNPVIRHVDPLIVDCTSDGSVAEISAEGSVLWHHSTNRSQGEIAFVGYATRNHTMFYEWNGNPESTRTPVTSVVLDGQGRIVQMRRSTMPVTNGGQVGLQWYPGGWIELSTGGTCSAMARGFDRSFRLRWSKSIPVDCQTSMGADEIGPLVAGRAVYVGVGSGPVEVAKFSTSGAEEWLRSINIQEGQGFIGPFWLAASPVTLWLTGLIGSPEGNALSAPELLSILRLETSTGSTVWQGRAVAQYPTYMTTKTKVWEYLEPDGGIVASGCRLSELLEGNYGTRANRLPVAVALTIGNSECAAGSA